jgi:hypothetical protein
MKWSALVLLLAGVLLAAGCTSPAPVPLTPDAPSSVPVVATPGITVVPELLGTWTGTSTGYIDQSGYVSFNDVLTLKVTGREGSFFTGEISFPEANGTIVSKAFAGVVGPGGKTFETIEYPGGFSDGVILSADAIELVFRDEAGPSTISLDSLKRATAAPGAAAAAAPVMPDLLGTWNGTSVGYMDQSGYQVIHGTMTMEVTGQDGRFFTGQIAYVMNGSTITKEFAGVLGADGKTIETLEIPDGFGNGVVVNADEIELTFRNDAGRSTIAIDSFRRATAPLAPAGKPAAYLVGNWSGTTTGYLWNGSGYEAFSEAITMEITDQADRLFKGQVIFLLNGTQNTKDFAGVFDRDGITFATIEFPDGFSDGIIVTADEVLFTFRDTGDPSRIAVDTFKRVA